jgi:DNA-directed RNA polymerase subunit H (RpoH/RPB5)
VVIIAKKDFDVTKHILVPKHTKLSKKEKNDLLEKYRITPRDLPLISIKDPAIAHLDVTDKDIIKIERPSPTSHKTIFYRKVVK